MQIFGKVAAGGDFFVGAVETFRGTSLASICVMKILN